MEYGNFGYTDEMNGASWGTGWEKAKAKGASEDERPYYHWHQYDPGVVPNLLQTGNGSPCGICVYEGNLLPPIYRNQIIHCDAGPKIVRAYPVKNDGAGYSATITNVLTSQSDWFRPSDVCVAPDGSLMIADWNDANVGGHNMADRELEKMTGRVYRIGSGQVYSAPKLDLTTPAGAVAALQSPNQAARYLAWSALHQQLGHSAAESTPSAGSTPEPPQLRTVDSPSTKSMSSLGGAKSPRAELELLKLWKSKNPRMRTRAIQLLARIKVSQWKYVDAALKDSDSDIRIVGLRTARSLKIDMLPFVKRLAKDPSP